MPTLQSTLTIDSATKKRASARAKNQSMSVSAVARILLNDYAAGRIDIGARLLVPERDENGFTPQKAAEMKKILTDIKDSRNLTKPLPAKKALADLYKML